MIPIKINKKKYSIKSIDELTTAEYIEMSKIENMDIVKYIAWQTGVDFNDAFFATTSKTLEKAIGQTKDVTKMSAPVTSYISYKKNIETVGQRYQIETSNLTGFDLIVFCLAVAQAQSNNIDKINNLRDYYLTKPWQEILPAGFFFYSKYKNGRNFVQNFLTKLLEQIRIKMLKKGLV